MIAEIHNKVSRTGSNLHDRLEDSLTGYVFGTLRYVPFQVGFQRILSKVQFLQPEKVNQQGAQNNWNTVISRIQNFDLLFWERLGEYGEIDVLFRGDESIIGFEMKYDSPLSSDDDIHHDDDSDPKSVREVSRNQLAKYGEYLTNLGDAKFLVFVAPSNVGISIVDDALHRNIMPSSGPLGLLTWESVHEGLSEAKQASQDVYHTTLFDDLLGLLEKRGLSKFDGWTLQVNITSDSYTYRSKSVKWNWSTISVRREIGYEFTE